ncbi:MAG: YggT family protein [Cellvibrionaceae bacterium]
MDVLLLIVFQIVKIFTTLYIGITIARFLLQLVKANFYNPISQFIVKATNPLLLPLRKMIPGLFGIDLASIVMAFLISLLAVLVLGIILTGGVLPITILLVGAFFKLINIFFYFYFFCFLLIVIVSWVAPHAQNPAAEIAQSIVEPVLRPIRRLIPPFGGMDFSIFFAGLGLWIVMTVLDNLAIFRGIRQALGQIL